MNHKAILSYLLVIGFFAFLIFAYVRYNSKINDPQISQIKEEIIESIKKELDVKEEAAAMDNAKVEAIIDDFIKRNPEAIIKTVEAHYSSKAEAEKRKVKEKITSLNKELENNPADPVSGSPNPKVKIVEFFDYSCGYCRKMWDTKNKLMMQNPDLQFVFKELPILNDWSTLASQAALAVNILDSSKYLDFQGLLLTFDGDKNEASIMSLAAKLGIDQTKLKDAIHDPKVAEIIESNKSLSNELGIQGTPSYVVGDQLIPGALNYDGFQKLIDGIRYQQSQLQ